MPLLGLWSGGRRRRSGKIYCCNYAALFRGAWCIRSRFEIRDGLVHTRSLTNPEIGYIRITMDKLCSAGEHGAWIVRSNHRPILGEEEHDALVAWLGDEEGMSEISTPQIRSSSGTSSLGTMAEKVVGLYPTAMVPATANLHQVGLGITYNGRLLPL